MKTRAVRYKMGEFKDGLWSVSETDRSAERETEPGLAESAIKMRL